MKSKFALAGHPIHPMLVAIPIGLFVWAFVCDLVYLTGGRDLMWYDLAFWTGIAAWSTGLIAALPGFGDYFTVAIKTDAREMGAAHMVLNVTTVALFFVAMLLMLDRGATSGGMLAAVVVLHGAGLGLVSLSGWLGGEMVYRHHIAVVPDTGELETEEVSRHREHGALRPRPR